MLISMTKKLKSWFVGIDAMAAFSLLIAGCSNTWKGLKKDTKKAGDAIEKAYKKTKKKIED